MSTDKVDDMKQEYVESEYVKKTPEQKAAELQAALEKDPGVHKFSGRAFYVSVSSFALGTRLIAFLYQLYWITLVACFCSGDSGFDGTVRESLLLIPARPLYFELTGAMCRLGHGRHQCNATVSRVLWPISSRSKDRSRLWYIHNVWVLRLCSRTTILT